MSVKGVVPIAWWLYVSTLVVAPMYPLPHVYPAWKWVPRERFRHREFYELNAKQLCRAGLEAICRYVDG
ncbi:MAG: hypothetical protein O7B35_05215 [Deltaproteobacteria bacterium]|nr:hypothetical protein [Deltaproteobacteria bacterium]